MSEYIDIEAVFSILLEENPFGWTSDDLADAVRCAAIADVAPVVHGKWREVTRPVYYGIDKQGNSIYRDRSVYYCSECNRKTVIKEKYCPDCGTKMDLEEDK